MTFISAKNQKFFWALFIFSIFAISVFSENTPYKEWVSGTVVHVSDGDTVVVETDGEKKILKVRFWGIDTPEKAGSRWDEQPYAVEASEFMTRLILNKHVNVGLTGEQTYSREVGEIFIDDVSASLLIVEAGLAWWNKKYAPHYIELQKAERKAKSNKSGLWADENPTPPWSYRRGHRRNNK